MANLIAAMICSISRDLKYGTAANKEDAKDFMESEWFEDIIVVMNMDAERVRWLIMHRNLVTRHKYE